VRLNVPAQPIIASIDAAQIEDAVLNLIINAIQASANAGTVNVSLYSSPEDEANEQAQKIVIEVSDEGRGISEENLARVFHPFFTTTAGGTGLGLPAVRRIARAHSGRVEVKSTPGAGSTFTIHLPLTLRND
jgi:two-component system sensor histidine kinase FlrB